MFMWDHCWTGWGKRGKWLFMAFTLFLSLSLWTPTHALTLSHQQNPVVIPIVTAAHSLTHKRTSFNISSHSPFTTRTHVFILPHSLWIAHTRTHTFTHINAHTQAHTCADTHARSIKSSKKVLTQDIKSIKLRNKKEAMNFEASSPLGQFSKKRDQSNKVLFSG